MLQTMCKHQQEGPFSTFYSEHGQQQAFAKTVVCYCGKTRNFTAMFSHFQMPLCA